MPEKRFLRRGKKRHYGSRDMKRALAAAVLGLSVGVSAAVAEPVKVGMITTLSGGGAGLGVDVRDGYLKHPIGRHFIFFRTTDDGIEVIRILHQRMDVGRHL